MGQTYLVCTRRSEVFPYCLVDNLVSPLKRGRNESLGSHAWLCETRDHIYFEGNLKKLEIIYILLVPILHGLEEVYCRIKPHVTGQKLLRHWWLEGVIVWTIFCCLSKPQYMYSGGNVILESRRHNGVWKNDNQTSRFICKGGKKHDSFVFLRYKFPHRLTCMLRKWIEVMYLQHSFVLYTGFYEFHKLNNKFIFWYFFCWSTNFNSQPKKTIRKLLFVLFSLVKNLYPKTKFSIVTISSS